MNDPGKFKKFVQATQSLAYWSRELLKTIDQPAGKQKARIRKQEGMDVESVGGKGDEK